VANIYMLDTNICSFIIRNQDAPVLEKLQECVLDNNRIVISSMTYAELMFGSVGNKASPKIAGIVEEFVSRLNAILALDKKAVEASALIKKSLTVKGMNIGYNDTLIAGHAISEGCVLVTNNTRAFIRVDGLKIEDWVN